MDRISELPDHALHCILSRLPTKQVHQCSIVSKSWLQARESFPVLDFHQGEFRKELSLYSGQIIASADKDNPIRDALDKFMKYVDVSMTKFVKKKLHMKRFKIFVSLINSNSVRAMDRWIELAVHNSIEELNLSFVSTVFPYPLPQILLSATSLKALSLCGCKLDDLALSMTYPFLKKLSLHSVDLDDRILHSLVASCTCIEDLELMSCKGLENLHVSGLDRLRTAKMRAFSKCYKVYIEAKNLENLKCEYTLGFQPKLSSRLRELQLRAVNITDQGLYDIMADSPQIETLYLRSCNRLQRLKISSDKLSKLELVDCIALVETKIDAFNLQNFWYEGIPISLFLQTSPSSSVFMSLKYLTIDNWMAFLTTSSIHLEVLSLSIDWIAEGFLKGFEKLPLPTIDWKIKHLKLDVATPRSIYAPILDGLLSSCKPKILSTTTMDHAPSKYFVEYLHKRLRNRAGGCSRSYPLRCWKHCLLRVEMKTYSGQPYKWDELSDLVLKLGTNTRIYYRLQWSCHEEPIKFEKMKRFISHFKICSCFLQ